MIQHQFYPIKPYTMLYVVIQTWKINSMEPDGVVGCVFKHTCAQINYQCPTYKCEDDTSNHLNFMGFGTFSEIYTTLFTRNVDLWGQIWPAVSVTLIFSHLEPYFAKIGYSRLHTRLCSYQSWKCYGNVDIAVKIGVKLSSFDRPILRYWVFDDFKEAILKDTFFRVSKIIVTFFKSSL